MTGPVDGNALAQDLTPHREDTAIDVLQDYQNQGAEHCGREIDLAAHAVAILTTPEPQDKVVQTRLSAKLWRDSKIRVGSAQPPLRPARPARPELRPPREMARRRRGKSPAARLALLHALAHIELNAVDLAWDIVARFTEEVLPDEFYSDWVAVAEDEARHFSLLSDRLSAFGGAYGDLPAHDGLWQAAEHTADDILARLALVPMVLEARALDVTPEMITRFNRYGDTESANVLEVIYNDEIRHVANGSRWFHHICSDRGINPTSTYHELVRRRYAGVLKQPFNVTPTSATRHAFRLM